MKFRTALLAFVASFAFISSALAQSSPGTSPRYTGLTVTGTLTLGDVTLSTVNNNELLLGTNEVLRFQGATGGFKLGSGGVAVYNEGCTTCITFQTSTLNSKTELVIQPNASPATSEKSVLSWNFQPAPNEERFHVIAYNDGSEKRYLLGQFKSGTGAYYPVVFYGAGTTEAFRINSATDSSVFFKQPVSIGSTPTLIGSARLSVGADANIGADANAAQLIINGVTDPNKRLRLGFDTTNNRGYIQAGINGTGPQELYLNQSGGLVTIGSGGLTVGGTVTMPTPFTLGATSVTTTGTQLNYLNAATGTTGTTSTNIVFSTSPTLVTPTLGVASATSINKVAITAPATSATLTIADGKTLTASNSLTFTGTDSTSFAFPATSGTVATLNTAQSFSAKQTVSIDDATTNAVTQVLRLAHTTTGTAAANIGTGLEFATESAGGTLRVGATIEAVATVATDGAEDFAIDFSLMKGGAAVTRQFRMLSTAAAGASLMSVGRTDLALDSGLALLNNNGGGQQWRFINSNSSGQFFFWDVTAATFPFAIDKAAPSSSLAIAATSGNVSSVGSIRARSGTAIPAGGTAGVGFTFSSTSNFGIFFGSGAPTLSAAKGSLYLRSDGSSTSTRAYINTDGATAWTSITTGS